MKKAVPATEPVKQRAARRPAAAASPAKRPEPAARASAPAVSLNMDDALPYLVTRAGVRMGQAFSKQIKPLDMTLAEWRVCASLHHKPHQRLSQLALNTSAEPSTLSRIVDGMIRRGLLARDRSGEDARAISLSLTAAGQEITRRIIPLAELYERVALAGIPKQQVASLKEMLHRIYDNVALLDSES